MFPKLLTITAFVLCLCGDGFAAPRIIDGIKSVRQYPFLAKLSIKTDNGSMHCGGSLISERWVLTAAHCVEEENIIVVDVCFGQNYQPRGSYCHGNNFKSISVHMHREYNPTGHMDNDIALIELDRNVPNTVAKPVLFAIPEMHIEYDGLVCNALGWGNIDPTAIPENATESDDLKETTPFALGSSNSPLFRALLQKVSPNFLYTFIAEQPGITSFGDSGGPLLTEWNGLRTLVGVVSHGSYHPQIKISDGELEIVKHKYDAYTKVANYESWIRNIIY